MLFLQTITLAWLFGPVNLCCQQGNVLLRLLDRLAILIDRDRCYVPPLLLVDEYSEESTSTREPYTE